MGEVVPLRRDYPNPSDDSEHQQAQDGDGGGPPEIIVRVITTPRRCARPAGISWRCAESWG